MTPGSPITTSPDRTWSMRTARTLARATDRQSRAFAAAGLVPRSGLTRADMLALRALAAIEAFPAPGPDPRSEQSPAPVAPSPRARAVADEARRAYPLAAPDWTLLVWADDARLATDEARRSELLASRPGQVVLLLPIGTWAGEIGFSTGPSTPGNGA